MMGPWPAEIGLPLALEHCSGLHNLQFFWLQHLESIVIPSPEYETPPKWSQICVYISMYIYIIPLLNHGFWGVLNTSRKRLETNCKPVSLANTSILLSETIFCYYLLEVKTWLNLGQPLLETLVL